MLTTSLLYFDNSTAWQLSFRVCCHLRATLCSAIYGQDAQAVSPDGFYGSPCCATGVFCIESWALGMNNSLGNFQVPLFWGIHRDLLCNWSGYFAHQHMLWLQCSNPVASEGFQNTDRDDRMEWTKYLTEGCMTLSEHSILNKFHRFPVPCSWCCFFEPFISSIWL